MGVWQRVLPIIAALFMVATRAQQTCLVSLTVDPFASTLDISGSVTKPLAAPLQPGSPEALIGLQGELTTALPGACPSSGAALADALAGAQLSTTATTGPLQLYPSNVTFKSGQLANLTWVGYAFNASLQLADDQTEASTLQLTIAEGYTLSVSLITPQGEQVSTIGQTGSDAVVAAVDVEGAGISITLSNLSIPLYAPYVSVFNGQELEGAVNYTISGTLKLNAATGCELDCGPNGRCSGVPDVAEPVCLCECGWGGASCDVPSGFCPRYAGEDAITTVIRPSTPITPEEGRDEDGSGAPLPEPSSSQPGATRCSKWEEWDALSGSCRCRPGWEGPGCDACTTDAACTSGLSFLAGREVDATCSTSKVYSPDTAYKAYTCDLAGTGLDTTIVPGTFAVGCNTTAGQLDVGDAAANPVQGVQLEEGAYCDVRFEMRSDPGNIVSCRTSLCSFSAGTSTVKCRTTDCQCASQCPDLEDIFKQIKGKPAVLDCDEENICTFDIQGFFVKLIAPCSNPECRVQGYTIQEIDYEAQATTNWDPLLAALPLLLLVVATLVLGLYVLSHRRLFSAAAGRISTGKCIAVERLKPDNPVSELSFLSLSACVTTRSGLRTVLSSVSGVVCKGELVGVLGPSGSGKTSLLSALSGSPDDIGRNATVRGSVTLDGVPLNAITARRMAYCAQDSTLLATLTVEECIRYSALLRLPQNTAATDLRAVVERAIVELGLTDVAGSLVGGSSGIRGISGGERRRVAIAMDLVTNPAVMLLDEPTSGLDSSTAYHLMMILKSVASSGRVVVLTFHQPSPAMFYLLDRTFLLAQGYCVYSGSPSAVEAHFAGLGLPCPAGTGTAEHMLHCATDEQALELLLRSIRRDDEDEEEILTAVGARAEVPYLSKRGTPEPDEAAIASDCMTASSGRESPIKGIDSPVCPAATSERKLGRELAILFWRTIVDILRNPTLLALHWGMSLLMGIFVGVIFWNVGNDVSGAQNRAGGLFFALAFFAFTSLTTVDLLMGERRMVRREVRGGYYRPGSYLAAKAMLDGLLLRAIPTFLYAAAFYPMMGLQRGSIQVLLFLCSLATFALAIGALSLAVSVACNTAGQASLCMNLLLLVSLLMGGFFVNVASIPGWIEWLHYLSPFYYGYSTLITNEMATLLLDFVVRGYAAVQNVRGSTFLEIIGVNMDVTTSVLVLDAMYVIFLTSAFVMLYLRTPRAAWLGRKR